MKKLLIPTLAAAFAMSFLVPANAAGNKVSASVRAECKAEAAKKFSAIHLIKRRNFANHCMAQHANAKANPVAASQSVKPATTGQTPK